MFSIIGIFATCQVTLAWNIEHVERCTNSFHSLLFLSTKAPDWEMSWIFYALQQLVHRLLNFPPQTRCPVNLNWKKLWTWLMNVHIDWEIFISIVYNSIETLKIHDLSIISFCRPFKASSSSSWSAAAAECWMAKS